MKSENVEFFHNHLILLVYCEEHDVELNITTLAGDTNFHCVFKYISFFIID